MHDVVVACLAYEVAVAVDAQFPVLAAGIDIRYMLLARRAVQADGMDLLARAAA